MNFTLGNYTYAPPPPPPPMRRVYAKNPGEPLAMFKVQHHSRKAALRTVTEAGFARAMELVK